MKWKGVALVIIYGGTGEQIRERDTTQFGYTAESDKLRDMYSVFVRVSTYIFFLVIRMQIISILEQLISLLLLEKRVKLSTCPIEGESTVSF